MSDADPDDDPRLRSVRAVWLSLPDEDPPERGLAELMAAAREKAELMARPPWWRRAFDVMTRPPVLAFATVVVLIGGAVLVGGRKDMIDVAPATAPGVPSTAPTPEPSGAADQQRPAAVEPDLEPAREATVEPAPPPPATAPTHGKASGADLRRSIEVKSPRNKRQAEPSKHDVAGEAGLADVDTAKQELPSPSPAPEPSPIVTGRGAAGAMPAPRADEDPPAPPVAQLVARCRAAAARGDCSTVRVLAQQVARRDPKIYSAQVARDAAIARCLSGL